MSDDLRQAQLNGFVSRRCLLSVLLFGLLLLVIVFAVTLFGWGCNQALTAELLKQKLRLGMTVKEAEYALALPPGSLEERSRQTGDGRTYADVSSSGVVGSWFVPQHSITLIFDKQGRLSGCSVEMHWRTDEQYMPCNLRSYVDAETTP